MANRLYMQRLDRITLVRKGKAIPKHPDLREGVVEVVKADFNWYEAFVEYINACPDDEIPETWEEGFETSLGVDVEKAKGKNYPDTEGPFAGPHNSFPIRNQSDVYDAARLIGHADSPAAVKARIISIAHSKGYSLPKSWSGNKVQKSEFWTKLKKVVLGDESIQVDGLDDATVFGEVVEKAANPMHSHSHAHLSSYGYSYSHTHDHNHRDGITPNSSDHDSHETAHAHQHVSKAGELPSQEDPVTKEEFDGFVADIKGLAADVEKLKAENAQLGEKSSKLEADLVEVTKSRDEAIAAKVTAEKTVSEAVEKAKSLEAERDSVTKKLDEQSRQPMTEGPASVQKSKPDIKQMSFDDAFTTLMRTPNA